MVGPPGSGKTMLAKRLPTILPLMEPDEAIETTRVHSVAAQLPADRPFLTVRPFRSPHHSISDAGLDRRGDNTTARRSLLAHNGILFLDEFAGISPFRARWAPSAAGGRDGDVDQSQRLAPVSRTIHVDCGDESLSLRVLRRSLARMPLYPSANPPLPRKVIRVRCRIASTSTSTSRRFRCATSRSWSNTGSVQQHSHESSASTGAADQAILSGRGPHKCPVEATAPEAVLWARPGRPSAVGTGYDQAGPLGSCSRAHSESRENDCRSGGL